MARGSSLGFFARRTKRSKSLVEPGNPAFGLGLALLAGVDRVRGAGDVQGDVGIGVAVAVFLGAVDLLYSNTTPNIQTRTSCNKGRARGAMGPSGNPFPGTSNH